MPLIRLLTHINSAQQRGLLWLAGSQQWTTAWLTAQLAHLHKTNLAHQGSPEIVRFSNDSSHDQSFQFAHDVRTKKFKSQLGRESDIVIFDAFAGFNPDAFGALAGTVKQGGLLILVSPPASKWSEFPDPELNRVCVEPFTFDQIKHRFIARLVALLNGSNLVFSAFEQDEFTQKKCSFIKRDSMQGPISIFGELDSNQDISGTTGTPLTASWSDESNLRFDCKTADQLNVVESILRLHQINSKRAVIVTADRGRGKSTSLAFAAAQIIFANNRLVTKTADDVRAHPTGQTNIIVTCPLADSINTLMKHFCMVMQPNALSLHQDGHSVVGECANPSNGQPNLLWSLRFLPPDQLGIIKPEADCVLIDEAAAIAIPLLVPIFEHYDFCVLASTQHGYEGTGRAFEYKLKPIIDQQFNHVETISMHQPIRWRKDDNLEPLVNRMLALDTGQLDAVTSFDMQQVTFTEIDQDQLASTPGLTEQVFALLVHAHYRTSPNDLRMMLDGPNIEVWVAQFKTHIVAAALVAVEGKIEPSLARQISQGRRRPRGHLFPQSLLNHGGFQEAGIYAYCRVIRIAVNPSLQRKGLGRQLLHTMQANFKARGFDFISTSFGLTESLKHFWLANGFVPARLGVKPEAATGELSILMWQVLNTRANAFYQMVNRRFEQGLTLEMRHIPERHKWQSVITGELDNTASLDNNENDLLCTRLTDQDKYDLTCLTEHFRLPDNCILALYRLTQNTHADDILAAWFNDGLPRQTLIEQFHIKSNKDWNNQIKQAAKKRLSQVERS